jgi:hypothetical protein
MLTTAQLATVKAAILADPALDAFPNTLDGAFGIAALLNEISVPDFFVWRTHVPVSEIMQNGFDWTRVDNLTVGKARIWEWMQLTGTINPAQANVRAGFIAVFTTAGDLATRQAIFGHSQRQATQIEKLLSTGSGTTTTDQGVGPATMGFEGNISYQDVVIARNS